MNNFNVEKVDNGFVVEFTEETQVEDGAGGFYTSYIQKTFVFETPAKLKKGLKLIVAKLTEKE